MFSNPVHLDFHTRLTDRNCPLPPYGDMVAFDLKWRLFMLENLSDQQGQRTFRSFELETFVFEFFDPVQYLLQFRSIVIELKPKFFCFQKDVAAAGEIADQNPAGISHAAWIDV